MNEEFSKRALQPIDPATVWNAETDPNHARTPLPKLDAEMVLGYEPANRHDRRKAAKLLKSHYRRRYG